MGGQGRCCCNEPPPECIPCEEQNPCSWSIVENILGMSFSGTFGAIDANCIRAGCECKREDAILAGTLQTTSPWSDWGYLWGPCGPCQNCDETPLEPCTEIFDPATGQFTIICPGDYPKYTIGEQQSRSSAKSRFWYSKAADVCVEAVFIGTTQVKFRAGFRWKIAGTSTGAYATKRRWREREFFCGYDIETAVGPPSSDDTITVPDPVEPCIDLIGMFCDAEFEPPVADPYCNVETIEVVTKDPCVNVVVGVGCVDDPVAVDLTVYESENCCNAGFGCVAVGTEGLLTYESEVFDCDSVPAEIELLPTLPVPDDIVLEWNCGLETATSLPGDVVFPAPTSLTLTITQCP